DRDARPRQGRAPGFSRARRDPLALRPHPGDVRRPHRRRARPARQRRRTRPADGRRSPGGCRMSVPYAKLPRWVDYGLIPLINLIVAFIVAGFVVLLVGENPFRAAVILLQGAFGSGQNIAFTLFYATNFIFTGLAVAVAFHCGLFNIGGEGQAYIAGLGV